MPMSGDVDLKALANLSEGLSGADLEGVCRDAAMAALREGGLNNLQGVKVSMTHMRHALSMFRKGVTAVAQESAQDDCVSFTR